jgi:uncharacterized ion transporter superfamily protein YfcC
MQSSTVAAPKKKHFKMPHVFALMMILTLFFSVLSYVLPSSTYQFKDVTYEVNGVEKTRQAIDPDSWAVSEEDVNVTPLQYLTSFMRGCEEVADIIFYIFLVGGSFFVVNETGALTAGLGRLIRKLGKRDILFIPILGVCCAAMGSTAGIAEELICFVPILMPIFIAAGYDSLLVVGVVYGATVAGWAGTITNPFTIGVAQGIAGLPVFSGMGYHILSFVVFTGMTLIFLTRYALKLKKDPSRSLMYELDRNNAEYSNASLDSLPEFDTRRKIILALVVLSIAAMLYGVLKLGWYFEELAAIFLVMGILTAFVFGKGISWFAESLSKGIASLVEGAMVVGLARSILVVLNDSSILHTILHGMAQLVSKLPSAISVIGQYIFQSLLNFVVPSGSGQAAVSMPIMAPLADLSGITRQTACLCEVYGDGLSNAFTPTSGPMMACLGLAGVPWTIWAKYWGKLLGLQYVAGLILILVAHWTNLGPF